MTTLITAVKETINKLAHLYFQGIINMATSENTLAFDLLKEKVQYLCKTNLKL